MKSIFSIDNPVFKTISRIGDMFIMSLLWLVTSLPIFTIGASTTALYDCCIKIIRARDTNVWKDFFRSFRSNFKQSTLIFLILLPIGVAIAAVMYFWARIYDGAEKFATVMNALSIGLAFMYVATVLFVFPVQAIFENPIKKTIKTAFFMAIKNLPVSILLVVISLAISYFSYVYPIVAYVFFLFGNGLFAMIYSVQFITVFRKYNPALNPDRPEECDIEGISDEKKEKTQKVKKVKGSKVIR